MKATLETDAVHRIYYQTFGDPANPALILIHGWNSYRGVWRGTADALKDRFFCVTLDLLGFGDSDKPKDGDYSIPAQAERVLKLVDELHIDQFTLVGHSMGAMIGMYIAARLARERIHTLIVVDGIVRGKPKFYARYVGLKAVRIAYYLPVLLPIARLITKSRYIAKWFFRPLFHDMNAIPYSTWADDRYVAIQPGSHIPSHRAAQGICACDMSADLTKIVCPTLIIFGEYDGIVPLSDGELAHESVPNSQFVVIDNCGHYPMYEQSDEFIRAVLSFL
jgi:pimeloyl-ACP methyl ester carboxylesterase